jgi:hypothetical protein
MLLYRSGWTAHQRTPLENTAWADGDACLAFFSESSEPVDYSLRCIVGSPLPRRVTIEARGRELWGAAIPADKPVSVDITVTGHHGYNKLYFKTDAPAVHGKEGTLPCAFLVMDLQVTKGPVSGGNRQK